MSKLTNFEIFNGQNEDDGMQDFKSIGTQSVRRQVVSKHGSFGFMPECLSGSKALSKSSNKHGIIFRVVYCIETFP